MHESICNNDSAISISKCESKKVSEYVFTTLSRVLQTGTPSRRSVSVPVTLQGRFLGKRE